MREAGDDPARRVDRAYRLAFGRPPTEARTTAGVEFLARQRAGPVGPRPEGAPADVRRLALTDYCQVLFGLNEFIYVD